jgi:uncharacterized protein (DUF885 family)/Tol biopolymer transport system component/streptogramin lyase
MTTLNMLRVLFVGVLLISACGQQPPVDWVLPTKTIVPKLAEAASLAAPVASETPRSPMAPSSISPTTSTMSEPAVVPIPSGIAISPDTVARVAKLHTLDGHSPRLAGLAFVTGSGRLASLSKDYALRLWDVATGQEVHNPMGSGGQVYNVAFSPDGALMATEGPDMTIQLWDVETGRPARTLAGHGAHLLCMTFSPDGGLLATAGDDALIKLWDVESGQELRVVSGHITPVTSLAFSPNGTLLASGSARFSTVIHLWDVESGDRLRTLVGHTDNVHTVVFSPDGTLLASASLDRTLRLWKVESGRVLHMLKEQGDPVYSLAFSPDGALLASSGDCGDVLLWDVGTGQVLRILDGHSSSVLSLAFSSDGTVLASGGIDKAVLLWGVPGAQPSSNERLPPQPSPVAAVTPLVPLAGGSTAGGTDTEGTGGAGLLVFSSYRQGESKLYTMNADGSDITCLSRTGQRETRPAWSPDGSRIAYVRRLGHSNHEIYVMNADGSGATRLTDRPDSTESEPVWSPDGSRIAFISNERPNLMTWLGRFQIWLINADGSEPTLLTEIGGANTSPDWSPDGSKITFDSTRDGNQEIYVINADGSEPVNLTQNPANDNSPAWSPDGTKIAFVSDRDGDQEIYVMKADGTGQTRLTERFGFDKGPSWSPDGQYIAFYSRHEQNNTDVYRMRADGSEQIRLTGDADFDGFPAWRPSPLAVAALPAPGLADEPPIAETAVTEWPAFEPPPVDEVVTELQGLPLDRFFEESFRHLMLRDPEWATAEGLADRFGIGNGQLTDLTDAYVRETQRLQIAILDMLRQYDRDSLPAGQQISYDVYEWYLDDLVRGQAFMYYDYPITHFTTGVQFQLIQLFTDLHPVKSQRDAEDYIRRLSQVDEKFEGLVEGLRLRKEAGVVLPRFLLPWLMGDIRHVAQAAPRLTPFYTAFEEKLDALESLSPDERQSLLGRAEQAIAESVIPAFAALAETLDGLESVAPTGVDVSQFPDGRAYYDYVLRHHTTTDLSADEIHELGLKELERIHGEMRTLFDQLGYPQEDGIPALYSRLAQEGDWVSGAKVAEMYEAIIDEAEVNLDTAFDIRPQAGLVVIAGSQGDYYVSASLDGSRPGAFYARISGGGQALYGMPTLAYHEAVPGHHFQIALAQESDLPLLRNVVGFTGYTEGWALYAEQLAHELGWYNDDAYGDLGRLQAQAFRAARLVVDTGLHARDWTFDQARQFMIENVGMDPGYMQFEVSRYIAWPGQATAYMVGMLKIQELRQRAMDRLGDRFDLKEFHRVVLSNGSMPLEVLERVVEDYIEAMLNQ